MILYDGIIVTMDSECSVYKDAALVIEENKIKQIGDKNTILEKYKDSETCKISCKGKSDFPGICKYAYPYRTINCKRSGRGFGKSAFLYSTCTAGGRFK